jgi:hypothetical protein
LGFGLGFDFFFITITQDISTEQTNADNLVGVDKFTIFVRANAMFPTFNVAKYELTSTSDCIVFAPKCKVTIKTSATDFSDTVLHLLIIYDFSEQMLKGPR